MQIRPSRFAKPIPAAVILGCVAALLLQGCRFQRTYASNRNGELEWSHGPRTVVVKLLGEIDLAPDDRDVAGISPDRYLLIEESVLLDSKAVEFTRRPDGSVGRRLLAGGQERPLDSEARAWIARMLPEVLRRTGLNASERAARILRQDGLDALLEEVRRLPSDSVRILYLREALRATEITPEQETRLLRAIGDLVGSDSRKAELLAELTPRYAEPGLPGAFFEAVETIGSSSRKAGLLQSLIEQYGDSAENMRAILTCVKTIGSDSQKAETLRSAVGRLPSDEAARNAFFEAVEGIGSDRHKARVLREAIRNHGRDETILVRSLTATGSIGSDSAKKDVLVEASQYFVDTDAVRQSYFLTVERIGSTSDRSRALMAVYDNTELDLESAARLFQSAGRLGSDSEKARLLTQLLDLYSNDPAVSRSFFAAVGRIASNHDRASVLVAAIRREELGRPGLLRVIESAEGLSGDSTKEGVLVAVARIAGDDDAISTRIRRAAATIHSVSSLRRVMAELAREDSRSE